MRFEATLEQRNFCINFLKQGKIANRGNFDGDYHSQLFGLIAQVIISDYLGLERPKNEGFDGGTDLEYRGKTFDVKCVIRTVDPKKYYINNLTASQIKYGVDAYIFMSYNKTNGRFTVCGWIDKKDFLKKASKFNEGDKRPRDDGTFMITHTDNYEISNKKLNDFRDLK